MQVEFPNFLLADHPGSNVLYSGIECSIQFDCAYYMVENSGTHNKSYFASTGAVMIVPLSLAY